MPNFTDPFPGIREIRPMSTPDLIRALRLDLAAEEDAISLYNAHAGSTGSPLAIKVLLSIANEERTHSGELLKLIALLDPTEKQFLEKGAAEVEDFETFAGRWR